MFIIVHLIILFLPVMLHIQGDCYKPKKVLPYHVWKFDKL